MDVEGIYKVNLALLGSIVVGTPVVFYMYYRATVGKYKRKMERVFKRRCRKCAEYFVLNEITQSEIIKFGDKVELDEYDEFTDRLQEKMEYVGYKLPKKNIRTAIGHVRVGNLINGGIREKDIDRLSRYLTSEMLLHGNYGDS